MRFRIAEFLFLIAVLAVGLAALRNPTEFMSGAIGTIAVASIWLAILLAFAIGGERRFFWIGFAVSGWLYLWLAACPASDDRQFRDNVLSTDQRLMTWQATIAGYSAFHPDYLLPDCQVVSDGGVFCLFPLHDQIASKAPSHEMSQVEPNAEQPEFDPLVELIKGELALDDWGDSVDISLLPGTGQTLIAESKTEDFEHFIRFCNIAHCLWTMLFAWLGGHICWFLRRNYGSV